MDKLWVDSLDNVRCSQCGKEIVSGFIIFSKKGNKIICKECDTKGDLQKKIKIVVVEFRGVFYNFLRIFNKQKVYRVLQMQNICLPTLLSEEKLTDFVNRSNVDVIIKN
jgi:DNA-directed RNA polymerase subunit RPC12/RpoP